MKRLLGIVKGNEDEDHLRRIQASIIGLTDDVPAEDLPWSYPLDEYCIVPAENDPVWIHVEKKSESEDYDYSDLRYENFTEKTPLEAYDVTESDSYKSREADALDNQPDEVDDVTYPKNRVIKISGITTEYDEENDRYTVTTTDGSFLTISKDGIILRSLTDSYDGTKGKKQIETEDGVELISGGTLEKMVLGETLDDYITKLDTWAKSHTHSHPMGPTGPTVSPPPSVPDFLSSKHKVD